MGMSTTLLGTEPLGQADSDVNRNTPFTLVLGGGGMKGLAHVGVIQAFLERGHRPTRIIGSSVGALVGAAWAGGMGIALPNLLEEIRRPYSAAQESTVGVCSPREAEHYLLLACLYFRGCSPCSSLNNTSNLVLELRSYLNKE